MKAGRDKKEYEDKEKEKNEEITGKWRKSGTGVYYEEDKKVNKMKENMGGDGEEWEYKQANYTDRATAACR
jgi:hypothetical protein